MVKKPQKIVHCLIRIVRGGNLAEKKKIIIVHERLFGTPEYDIFRSVTVDLLSFRFILAKDTLREKAFSNEISAFKKSMNMGILVVGTSTLYKRSFY